MKLSDSDHEKYAVQAAAERQAECDAVKERFPIDPNDPREQQEKMRIARQVAMTDP